MDVSVQKKEIVAAICVTFNEADIKWMKELVKKSPSSQQGQFIHAILERAEITVKTENATFWYVTICGDNYTLADAISTIRSLLPNYASGITSPANWFSAREVCVGMWKEQNAKKVQNLLSDKGFQTSLIKAS